MSYNSLFNFIHEHVSRSERSDVGGSHPVLALNKQEQRYYRFEFDNKKPTTVGNYRLREHHISVYETENIFYQSQYHYTGHFIDEVGREHQLHVYFNTKDEITTLPIFSIHVDGDTFRPIEVEALNEPFMRLARLSCNKILSSLRIELTCKVQQLEEKYNCLENEACAISKDLDTRYEAYISKLREISVALQRIISLVSHGHYRQIDAFIQKMLASLVSQHVLSEDVSSTESVMPKEIDIAPAQLRAINPTQTIVMDAEINDLMLCFNQLKNTDEAYTRSLMDIYRETYRLSLLVDEEGYSASLNALTNLRTLNRHVCQAGEKLLIVLMLSSQFELAKELSPFYHRLTTKHLFMALTLRKHDLLDFLLESGNFSINTQPVTVKTKDYFSAVHYCIESDTITNPMVDSLAVLIKHNASILINDERGLPLAHRILSIPDHPLRPALEDTEINRAKTVMSVNFYKILISELTCWLVESPLDKEERQSVDKALELYHLEKSRAADARLPYMRTFQGRALQASVATLTRKQGAELFTEKLKRDQDVIQMVSALEKRSKFFISKLAPAIQRQWVSRAKCSIDEIITQLEGVDIDQSFEEVKSTVIRRCEELREVLEKRIELVDIQSELKDRTRTTISKKTKKLICTEARLVREINEYDSRCGEDSTLPLEGEMTSVKKLLNTLNTLTNALTSFSAACAFFQPVDPRTEHGGTMPSIAEGDLDEDPTEKTDNPSI